MPEVTIFSARVADASGDNYVFSVDAFPTGSDKSMEFRLKAISRDDADLFTASFIATDAPMVEVCAWGHHAIGTFALCVTFQFGPAVLAEVYRVWGESRIASPNLSGKARWRDVIERLKKAGSNLAVAAAQSLATCAAS